jgi:hypothetical protein
MSGASRLLAVKAGQCQQLMEAISLPWVINSLFGFALRVFCPHLLKIFDPGVSRDFSRVLFDE